MDWKEHRPTNQSWNAAFESLADGARASCTRVCLFVTAVVELCSAMHVTKVCNPYAKQFLPLPVETRTDNVNSERSSSISWAPRARFQLGLFLSVSDFRVVFVGGDAAFRRDDSQGIKPSGSVFHQDGTDPQHLNPNTTMQLTALVSLALAVAGPASASSALQPRAVGVIQRALSQSYPPVQAQKRQEHSHDHFDVVFPQVCAPTCQRMIQIAT